MTLHEQTEALERKVLSPFTCLSSQLRGQQMPPKPCPTRICFRQDINRIIHSKISRWLKHKTRVFLEPEGDHYRTRMTHTIKISRIVRTTARGLRLNEDLVEAAAYGHDLGHTSFGHTGKWVLNEVLPGGFTHNEQSLRVVDRLGKEGEGFNLVYEVRRGILCHTDPNRAEALEGQPLRLADKIAHINHDIDNAIRGRIIYPMDIPLSIPQVLGFIHSEQVSTLTVGITTQGIGRDAVLQSPACRDAMGKLRAFVFEFVYRNSVAKGEEGKVQGLLHRLLDYHWREPDKLSPEFQNTRMEEDMKRAVYGYIVGMTDVCVAECFNVAFIPKFQSMKQARTGGPRRRV